MWVESDQLLPSGESLVRQLLFGQRYFKSRFGSYCRTFWLPDSFGYNAQIPQLARLAGCDFFFTQKISWNQFNDFPLTSFRWKGQDGTQIVCHFCPQNTVSLCSRFRLFRMERADENDTRYSTLRKLRLTTCSTPGEDINRFKPLPLGCEF